MVWEATRRASPGWVRTDISVNALDGDGKATNIIDPTIANGISAEDCAEQIVRALQRDKYEVIIGKGLSRIAPLMKQLSPALVGWVNRRAFR